MNQVIEILQFVVPCWVINLSLNAIYVIKLYFPKINLIDSPIDGKYTLPDKNRILGESTTFLGIIMAIMSGVAIKYLLRESESNVIWLGIITGMAVYLGHAAGSFIKRRFNYSDGEYMPFVDHADYVIVAGIVLGLMKIFSLKSILVGVAITYVVHPIVTYLAYKIGWHKNPT